MKKHELANLVFSNSNQGVNQYLRKHSIKMGSIWEVAIFNSTKGIPTPPTHPPTHPPYAPPYPSLGLYFITAPTYSVDCLKISQDGGRELGRWGPERWVGGVGSGEVGGEVGGE